MPDAGSGRGFPGYPGPSGGRPGCRVNRVAGVPPRGGRICGRGGVQPGPSTHAPVPAPLAPRHGRCVPAPRQRGGGVPLPCRRPAQRSAAQAHPPLQALRHGRTGAQPVKAERGRCPRPSRSGGGRIPTRSARFGSPAKIPAKIPAKTGAKHPSSQGPPSPGEGVAIILVAVLVLPLSSRSTRCRAASIRSGPSGSIAAARPEGRHGSAPATRGPAKSPAQGQARPPRPPPAHGPQAGCLPGADHPGSSGLIVRRSTVAKAMVDVMTAVHAFRRSRPIANRQDTAAAIAEHGRTATDCLPPSPGHADIGAGFAAGAREPPVDSSRLFPSASGIRERKVRR
jgi:hypothetical protein